ncbi:unnamed protein product [Euphydryas editha]|uniref:FLYWCH-type domain-containing protein n=1 Tax=Euphydryas editha TaxID=104508 RepID=A0AAU9TDM0_EUPED|nr:unnamed protein product [Euphydryas editha]
MSMDVGDYFTSVQWVKNKSGKIIGVIDGYTFYCNTKNNSSILWRCCRSSYCKARLVTTYCLKIIRCSLEHNHVRPNFIIKNVQWVQNKVGKIIGVIDGYTFYCSTKNNSSILWRCCRSSYCKARLVTTYCLKITRCSLEHNHVRPNFIIKNVTLVWNKSGKQVAVLNGFTYYCASTCSSTVAWRCTRGKTCKARFVTTKDISYVIRCQEFHGHNPPNFYIYNVKLFKNEAGKSVAILYGFTYYCGKKSTSTFAWRCRKGKSCKARFITNKNLEILKCQLVHEHLPPAFYIENGVFYRL